MCLLCDSKMIFTPTWRGILLRDSEEAVCKKCKAEFDKIQGPKCCKCGSPGQEMCTDCTYWETTEFAGCIDSGNSLYHYNGAMKTFLHRYKFLQDVALSEVFAADINRSIHKPGGIIVPIPMHHQKLKERTFPQVERLLDAAGIRHQQFLIKSDAVQGTKTKIERMAVKNLFQWNEKAVPEKVLLVDDLYTTGTTLRQAAKVMKDAGAKEVRLLALIRG